MAGMGVQWGVQKIFDITNGRQNRKGPWDEIGAGFAGGATAGAMIFGVPGAIAGGLLGAGLEALQGDKHKDPNAGAKAISDNRSKAYAMLVSGGVDPALALNTLSAIDASMMANPNDPKQYAQAYASSLPQLLLDAGKGRQTSANLSYIQKQMLPMLYASQQQALAGAQDVGNALTAQANVQKDPGIKALIQKQAMMLPYSQMQQNNANLALLQSQLELQGYGGGDPQSTYNGAVDAAQNSLGQFNPNNPLTSSNYKTSTTQRTTYTPPGQNGVTGNSNSPFALRG